MYEKEVGVKAKDKNRAGGHQNYKIKMGGF